MDHNQDPVYSTGLETAGKIVSMGLNFVPIIGGTLSNIANEIISKRQNRRLNDFLDDLAEKLKNNEDKMNREFIHTEEFQDLAEDIFSKAADTRQKEKLEALKSVFLNTVLSEHPNYDEAMEIASLIDQWQPRHIILLKILDDPIKADREMGNAVGFGED